MRCRRVLIALWQILRLEPLSVSSPDGLLDAAVTPQETLRLMELRQRFRGQPEYLELDINERKLQFALWLVEHGQLNEFPHRAPEAAQEPEGLPRRP
jgi:hypothetical protein